MQGESSIVVAGLEGTRKPTSTLSVDASNRTGVPRVPASRPQMNQWTLVPQDRLNPESVPLDGGQTDLHGPPWVMLLRGIIPDVTRLGAIWLLFALMTNATIWWIGCLERQNRDTVLVQ